MLVYMDIPMQFYYLFIRYFWLHWVFVASHRPSLIAVSGGYALVVVGDKNRGFLLQWLLLLQSTSSRVHKLQKLRYMGLAAPQHVESSQTRDQTCVPCTSRWISYQWTTREVPNKNVKLNKILYNINCIQTSFFFLAHKT